MCAGFVNDCASTGTLAETSAPSVAMEEMTSAKTILMSETVKVSAHGRRCLLPSS